jgi:hypothetical protein
LPEILFNQDDNPKHLTKDHLDDSDEEHCLKEADVNVIMKS